MVNELLQKHIELKESEAIQEKFEVNINAETKHKFNNSSIILEEILSRQRSPNDKLGIGFAKLVSTFVIKTSTINTLFAEILNHPQGMK